MYLINIFTIHFWWMSRACHFNLIVIKDFTRESCTLWTLWLIIDFYVSLKPSTCHWPPNSEGATQKSHNIACDPTSQRFSLCLGETQWCHGKYQTFLCFHPESNWPYLRLFDEWLSGTYMAEGDLSLMADWACQQSHYNLQFDILQAELFDSHDSYCHPHS